MWSTHNPHANLAVAQAKGAIALRTRFLYYIKGRSQKGTKERSKFLGVFRRWKKSPEGSLKWDALMLKLPLFGQLLTMVSVARFSRTLATLLSSGVPVLEAMRITRNVLGNEELAKVVDDARESVREGEGLAKPLKASQKFPPIVTHMIAIGEKSGQLEEMLENVAEAYDSAVDNRVQMLTSLLEPLIIVVMGGAVAFIAMSILFPLMQMSSFVE